MRALVGLGSNLGDRAALLAGAARLLRSRADPKGLRVSHLYETRPWGVAEQPDFLNAVAVLETDLDAGAFLGLLKEIERNLGRVETERWGPRLLDLDLLDLGGRIVDREDLKLPHPRIAQRAFVLVPLCEVLPAWTDPLTGRTAVEMLVALDPDPAEVRPAGRLPLGEEDRFADAAGPDVSCD